MALKEHSTGWAKSIRHMLEQWELESDWEIIATKPINTWRREVHQAAEKHNKEKLLEECQTRNRGTSRLKTKTKSLVEKIQQ